MHFKNHPKVSWIFICGLYCCVFGLLLFRIPSTQSAGNSKGIGYSLMHNQYQTVSWLGIHLWLDISVVLLRIPNTHKARFLIKIILSQMDYRSWYFCRVVGRWGSSFVFNTTPYIDAFQLHISVLTFPDSVLGINYTIN